MSISVIQAVFESALGPHLRLTALAVANFAADDGTRIYPSVDTLAKMTGKRPRAIKNDLRALRALGVLVPDNLRGGRGKTTRYTMNLAALKGCAQSCQQTVQRNAPLVESGRSRNVKERVNGGASFGLLPAEPQRVQQETETVQPETETVQPTSPDPSDPPLIHTTKPSPLRRSISRADANGEEQGPDLSTPLHRRERCSPDAVASERGGSGGADQDSRSPSPYPLQHRTSVESLERRPTLSEEAVTDKAQRLLADIARNVLKPLNGQLSRPNEIDWGDLISKCFVEARTRGVSIDECGIRVALADEWAVERGRSVGS